MCIRDRAGPDGAGSRIARLRAHHCLTKVCIMGDFNFHSPGENVAIWENGYVDVWRELRGASARAERQGLSWQGSRCWWLPFDDRAMRLDRVILGAKSTARPVSIELFGAPAIPQARCCGALDWLFPVYPSDHLGLVMELELDGAHENPRPRYVAQPYELSESCRPFQGRTFREIVCMRIGAVVLAVVGLARLAFLCAAPRSRL
eukprot:TRINITY_DN2569_c0_g1_i3.p1 TRINITY_DN2569_c0_g1~~TRINITY_DN2569_c0_g1_i3.p1  ORF type:complete len:204 (-),score=27.21 TRINITY_DN2569_c0_g1_i3:307-918(-)